MIVHDLKTWPAFFQAVLDGRKRHEIRHNDRNFAVGDALLLREFEPMHRNLESVGKYTGRTLSVRVTYITEGGEWGLPRNVCVMSIALGSEKS